MVHRELLKLGLALQSQQKGVDRLLLFIEPIVLEGHHHLVSLCTF